jgi:hypothetical protein
VTHVNDFDYSIKLALARRKEQRGRRTSVPLVVIPGCSTSTTSVSVRITPMPAAWLQLPASHQLAAPLSLPADLAASVMNVCSREAALQQRHLSDWRLWAVQV